MFAYIHVLYTTEQRSRNYLDFCLSVRNFWWLVLFAFQGKTSVGLPVPINLLSSLLYMIFWDVYRLLGTTIHLLEIKWRTLKIWFRAVMDVILFAFHGGKGALIPMNFCWYSIHSWCGYRLIVINSTYQSLCIRPLKHFWKLWFFNLNFCTE